MSAFNAKIRIMGPAGWAMTALAVLGGISASIGLYRVITAQQRADRARTARARRLAEVEEAAASWNANTEVGFDEDIKVRSKHIAESISLASPGDDEIPRTTRSDYVLLAVGLLANTTATLIGVVAA